MTSVRKRRVDEPTVPDIEKWLNRLCGMPTREDEKGGTGSETLAKHAPELGKKLLRAGARSFRQPSQPKRFLLKRRNRRPGPKDS